MKLLDFITVNDFLSYLQSGDSQCKPIYDFYMRWLQQSNKKIEEQTTENFIEDIEQVSNFFEVLNNATSMAVENIQSDTTPKMVHPNAEVYEGTPNTDGGCSLIINRDGTPSHKH